MVRPRRVDSSQKAGSGLVLMVCLLGAISSRSMGQDASIQRFWNAEWERQSFLIAKAATTGPLMIPSGKNLRIHHLTYSNREIYKPPMRRNDNTITYPAPFLDSTCLIWESDRDALDLTLRRVTALINDLRTLPGCPDLSSYNSQLTTLKSKASATTFGDPARKQLYLEACALRRKIAFSNPLLDFDEIVAMTGGVGTGHYWQHMAWNRVSSGGSGPMIISNWKTGMPTIRRMITPATSCENGDLKGTIPNKWPFQSFHLNYDLSFDARQIYFVANSYGSRIFRMNVDGTGLYDLSVANGNRDMAYPCLLPNGRIVFCTRAAGKGDRCEGGSATLYSMKSDGTDLYPISWHETPEYHPVVDNDGMIVYSRWDYIDRNWEAAQHIWTCYPDGRDPRAPHGNYPGPHNMLDTACPKVDGRMLRPWSELYIRPIPGQAGKYVAISSIHHSADPGIVVLIDTKIPDDNKMAQVRLITGTCMPHESDDRWCGGNPSQCSPDKRYTTPWPLSQSYHLVSDQYRILLLDKFGNIEPIYEWIPARDSMEIGIAVVAPADSVSKKGLIYSPRPLKSRPVPPNLSTRTFQGERATHPDHKKAVISVLNVYNSDFAWPKGAVVKKLRIVQVTQRDPTLNYLNIFYGSDGRGLTKLVIGTVPVESDGSAYFEAPVGRLIFFQAVDSLGTAVMSMRSGTYVHPGEHLSCSGCHEDKWKSVPPGNPRALQRSPSQIEPDVNNQEPVNYYRLVKPVFEGTCLPCHKEKGQGIQDVSYDKLKDITYWLDSRGGFYGTHAGYRSVPGRVGARGCKMGQTLIETHQSRITREEFRKVVLWLDAGSNRLGTHWDEPAQVAGKLVWPRIEFDSTNPSGVERIEGYTSVRPSFEGISGLADKAGPRIAITAHTVRIVNAGQSAMTLRVRTLDGRTVLVRKIGQGRHELQLDELSLLRPGVYFVSAEGPFHRSVAKVAVWR